MSAIYSMLGLMLDFFNSIYDFIFLDAISFLEANANGFTEFLLDVIEFVGLDSFLADVSLGGMLFSTGIIAAVIIYFFIP